MTVVNLLVATVVLACGLAPNSLWALWVVAAIVVALALTVPASLARRQGAGPDGARVTAWQWALFVATWAGIVLWSVADTWAWAAVWAQPLSLEPNSAPPRDEGWIETLRSLSTGGQVVAAISWLVLVVHLSVRLGGRRAGPAQESPGARPRWYHRWPDLVFTVMIPGNLAIIVWVAVGGGLVAHHSGIGQLVTVLMVAPVLLIMLLVSTIQAVRSMPRVRGALLTPPQAGLQVGLWASLGLFGAGMTVTDFDGEDFSAILTLFPGAVAASQVATGIGVTGFLVVYVLLLRSLRAQRAPAHKADRNLVTRSKRA